MADRVITFRTVWDKTGAVKSTSETIKEVQKLETVAKKSSNGIAAGFLKAELAMKGLRAAFKLGSDSMKTFAEQTGDKTLATFSSQIAKVQLQIGAGLTKEVGKFTKYFQDNEKFILTAVANLTEGFLGFKDVVVGTFGVVGNSIYIALEGVFDFFVSGFEGAVTLINAAVQLLPKNLVPKGWQEGMNNFSVGVTNFRKSIEMDMAATASTIADSARLIGTGFGRVGGAFAGNTGITTGSPKAGKDKNTESDKANKALQDEFEKSQKELLEFTRKINEEILTEEIEKYKELSKIDKEYYDNLSKSSAGALKHMSVINAIATLDKIMASKKQAELEQQLLADQAANELNQENMTMEKAALIEEKYAKKRDALIKAQTEREIERAGLLQKAISIIKNRADKELEDFDRVRADTYLKINNDTFMQQKVAIQASFQEQYDVAKIAFDDQVVAQEEFNQLIIDMQLAKNEQMEIIDAQHRDNIISNVGTYVDAVVSAQGMINDTISKYATYQNFLIDENTTKEKTAAKSKILNKRDLTREYERIDADADKKRRKLQKAQMLGDIAMAIASGAQATINGLKTQPFFPLGIIMGALAATMSTASVGTMVAQYGKMAKGGVVKGDAATGDSQPTLLTPGEVVLNKTQQANTLMAIANGQAQKGINLTGGSTSVVINGNADEAVIDRALQRNRQQQMKDMKALIKDMQYNGSIRMAIA